jgi:5-methyltetrahydropteroyltriglutamate--homocysteine methyltransferase
VPLTKGGPLIPTTTIGSYAMPGWYQLAREHVDRGELADTDLRELVEDASAVAISDQERAGLDVVSDGEARRADFIMSFYGRLDGLHQSPPRRRLGPYLYDSTPVYETVARVNAPDGLGCVAEFEFASSRTDRLVKVAVPGPLTLTNAIRIRDAYSGRDDLAEDLVAVVNAELRALVAAGCRFVQVDEPSYSAYWADAAEGVKLFNRCVEGIPGDGVTVGLHVCFGNLRGRPQSARTYAPILPHLRDARCDIVFLEFANREMAEADLWARHDLPQALGAGVVDVKSFHRERPEDVAARLRGLLDAGVPPERLWAVPDCGLWETPRWLAFAKLKALTAGAELVRQELSFGTSSMKGPAG